MTCKHGHEKCKGRDLDKEEQMLKEYGFFCHLVMDDPDSPYGANFHTHGLPEIGHPDIQIVLPLPPQVYGGIIHGVYDFIKAGNKLELERAYDNFLENMNVQFVWAVENDRDVLRMILPDKKGETMKELMNCNMEQWEGTYPKPEIGKLTE